MKKTNIFYWIFTGLFAALMLSSGIQGAMNTPETVQVMHGQLGYPNYFTTFISVAKVLGAIAILIPGFPRIKEWAYAGLMFDLLGATYSIVAAGLPGVAFMILPFVLGIGSYFFYHKRRKLQLGKLSGQGSGAFSGAALQ